jgi:hypothetical protein
LGIGDWGLGPIPNPQSPIPNPQSPIPNKYILKIYFGWLKLQLLIYIYEIYEIIKKYKNGKKDSFIDSYSLSSGYKLL